jgi:hypothetical protein
MFVLIAEDGKIVRVTPSGDRKQIGKVRSVAVTSKLDLKKGKSTPVQWKKSQG